MANIPGYEYDIFISYAHADDKQIIENKPGWVTSFVGILKNELNRPVSKEYKFWFDRDLDCFNHHEEITPQIVGALERSSILIIFLSPHYVSSNWCKREKSAFLSVVQKRIRSGSRVFIVRKEPEENTLPEFRDIVGYKFYEEPEDGGWKTLGYPLPIPDDRKYFNNIIDLTRELKDEMEKLKKKSCLPSDSRQTQPPAQKATSTVYLAEAADDVDEMRDEVQRYLAQFGIAVSPLNDLPRGEAEFISAVDGHLAGASCFVQLLGKLPGKRPQGSEKTYAQLQYDRAIASGKQPLQWRDPNIDLSGIASVEYRRLLESTTVMRESLEVFKSEIKKFVLAKDQPAPIDPGNTFVFVNRESRDADLADEIIKILDKQGEGWALPGLDLKTSEKRRDLEKKIKKCTGMILVYGSTPFKWIENQLEQYEKIIIQRDKPIKALALYQGPPGGPITYKPRGMEIIDCRQGANETKIIELLKKVKQELAS